MAVRHGRLNPKNRQHAFAYQFIDLSKTLLPLSLQENPKGFEQQIWAIEQSIKAYRSKRLRKMSEKAKQKTIERIKHGNDFYGKKNSKRKSERFPFGCSSCLGEGCTNCR